MHSSGKNLEGEEKQPQLTEPGERDPGGVVVERGRTGTRARAGRSTPRGPGAALGDVPALTGGGGSRLTGVLARPLPAPLLTRYELVGTRSRISGASLA